jgi:acetyl-CoA carboxylase biotin carboxyl carrier protein
VADDNQKSTNPAPFDVRTVKSLVALMTQHDLSEIDLRDGMQRLRIRRGSAPVVTMTTPASAPIAATPTATATASSKPATEAPAAKPGKKLLEIKSESVGTFYAKPRPEDPPFVSVGSKVTPTTVVCLIEAMKLFSEVQAGIAGTIVETLVENQSPVEFGQVLFRVDPA